MIVSFGFCDVSTTELQNVLLLIAITHKYKQNTRVGGRWKEEQICDMACNGSYRTYESSFRVYRHDIIYYLFCFWLGLFLALFILQWRKKLICFFDKTFMNSKMNFCHSSVIKLERMNVSASNSLWKLEIFYHKRFLFVSVRKLTDKQKAKLFTYRIRLHILSSKSLKQFSAIDLIFNSAFSIIFISIVFVLSFMTSSEKT